METLYLKLEGKYSFLIGRALDGPLSRLVFVIVEERGQRKLGYLFQGQG